MPTLDWIGKQAVLHHHRDVPYRLIHCDKDLSAGDPDAGNLLVQGDNLEALKALLPYYAGKVKCIYIDPPYNTGNEGWVYNDNVNSPEMKKWLGQVVGKEAEDLSRHDKWLCMMYPRLRLLREFLSEDGVIFVSIDDNEVHLLRCLLDEIFGSANFIITIAWQKRYSRENRGDIGDAHEYLLVYGKKYEDFRGGFNRIPLDAKSSAVYKNPNDDPKGKWRIIPMTAQGFRPNQMYPIETPSGKIMLPPKGRCWSMVESEFIKLKDEGRIWFGKNGNSAPGVRRYLSEVEGLIPWSWWPHEEVGHTDEAKKELLQFEFDQIFDTPKPRRLISRVLQIATDKDALILDSFAGSGTTGHAVLDLNKQDGGNRKFILVEMDETIAGDVTAERLKRVVNGYDKTKGEKSEHVEGLGSGFRFCRLGTPLFDEFGGIANEVTYPDLAAHIFFSETGSPIPQKADETTTLLGTYQGRAIYLLYDAATQGFALDAAGNTLTPAMLGKLPLPAPGFEGLRVVYAEGCTVTPERLREENVVFKQIPYQIGGA